MTMLQQPIGTEDLHFPLMPEVLKEPIQLRMVLQRNFEQVGDTFQILNRYLLGDPVHFKSVAIDKNLTVGGSVGIGTSLSVGGAITADSLTTLNGISNQGGELRTAAHNNSFGAGALGAANASYLNIGTLGDSQSTYVDANSTYPDCPVIIRSKGVSNVFLQTANGAHGSVYLDGGNYSFYANGLSPANTHEGRRRDAQSVMSGFGFSYAADGAGHGGATAGIAVAINRGTTAVEITNNGSGNQLDCYYQGAIKFYINGNSEIFHAVTSDIYLGRMGGTGCRVHFYSGDPNVLYDNVESTAADCHRFFNLKGTGIYRFYGGSGQYMADIRGTTEVSNQQTALWLYWVDAGGVARFTKVLAVPNTLGGAVGAGSHVLIVQ